MTFEEAKAAVVANTAQWQKNMNMVPELNNIFLALVDEIDRLRTSLDLAHRNISALSDRPSR